MEHRGWLALSEIDDDEWIDKVVLKVIEMPTLQIEHEMRILRLGIRGWMAGMTYEEISEICGSEIDETLKLLGYSIGYHLQDSLAKLSQLALEKYVDFELSELAASWASLLQYGLGDLQQLDLFERGLTDRLAVWGLSRYLSQNNITSRGDELLSLLRGRPLEVIQALELDSRVPELSRLRSCDELNISI